jgi:YD repeat-containing protein
MQTDVQDTVSAREHMKPGPPHRGDGAAGQTTSFAYDADGNLTEIADPLGRVTSQIDGRSGVDDLEL